jgi:hypothetical protein
MLGDGTRFFKKLDASGVVTFEDPSLMGPQDVTVVVRNADGFSRVNTYLALERPEVWLPGSRKSSSVTPQRAYITGKVKGMGDPFNVSVKAVGRGIWDSFATRVNTDGSFRVPVEGTLPAVVDLVVVESDPWDLFESKAVGLKRGIALSAGQELSGQEVVLDHPINQQTQLTIQGAEVYQQDDVSASLRFYLDGKRLLETTEERGYPSPPGLPASLPSFSLTAPFETVRVMLAIEVGSLFERPSGRVYARAPVENLSSVTLSLPKPATLTAPAALGPGHEPTPVHVDRVLVFQWSADAAAQMVEFSMFQDYPGKFFWTVTAPGSVTSFTPFRLRLDETSFMYPSFHGPYQIFLDSSFDAAKGHYADYFTQTPPDEPFTPAWQTSLEGELDFR